jgi:ABC-type Co2+ transport system permease subunit
MVLGALACGLQIGFSPLFSAAGGIAVTVPSMLFWHIIIGFGEAIITATLLTQLKRMPSVTLSSLLALKGGI